MSPPRLVDLHGPISACDSAGRLLHVHCAGEAVKIDAASMRAALSAFFSLRASGVVDRLAPDMLDRLADFRIEICVRGQFVGRAGAGAHTNWADRALTKLPLELRIPPLLWAAVKAF